MNYCYWNTTMLTRCVTTALWRSCISFVTYFWRFWSAFNMFEDVFLLLLADHILITLLPDLCQRTFSWDRWSSRFFLNSASMSHRSERSFSTFSKGALRLHAAHVHSKPYLRGSIKNSKLPFGWRASISGVGLVPVSQEISSCLSIPDNCRRRGRRRPCKFFWQV